MIPSDIRKLMKPGLGMTILPELSEFDYDAWNGRLLIWEAPEPRETYVLGVDPATGVGADRSVCEILKLGNLQHPDVQVAEFACDFLDPVDFAGVVNIIGRFYHDVDGTEAFCSIEANAECGDTMIADLRMRLDYTNLFIFKQYDKIQNMYTNKYGWWTNKTTRPKLIARGLHAFAYGDLVVHSPFCLDEMADFERDHTMARAQARHGRHDDRLMALLIAHFCGHDEEWLNGEDIAEERRLYQAAQLLQKDLVEQTSTPGRRVDYQSRPISFSKMYEESDATLMNSLDE